MTAKIDADLQRELDSGASEIHAILHVDTVEGVRGRLPKGLRVRREFRLVPGFAVTGSSSDLVAASEVEGVRALEADRDVHTQ